MFVVVSVCRLIYEYNCVFHLCKLMLIGSFTLVCLCQTWLAGLSCIMFSTCPFVSFQTCEHNISKMNKPVLMPIGTSGLCAEGVKLSTLQIWRSRSWRWSEIWRRGQRHHFQHCWIEQLLYFNMMMMMIYSQMLWTTTISRVEKLPHRTAVYKHKGQDSTV